MCEQNPSQLEAEQLARTIARSFQEWPEVEAVALGGSRVTAVADNESDIDLYVYTATEVPVSQRRAFIESRSISAEVDNCIWETGDEWKEAASGVAVDVMYRNCRWIEGEIARVLVHHQSSLGYTTTLWHNVLTSQVLFDRDGWYTELKRQACVPYPKDLARAIVQKNYTLLSKAQSSFTRQILGAAARNDTVAVNHRIAAFLASYFDVLFAANLRPHPGEKRLLLHARKLDCFPSGLSVQLADLFSAAARCDQVVLSACLADIVHGLDVMLSQSRL